MSDTAAQAPEDAGAPTVVIRDCTDECVEDTEVFEVGQEAGEFVLIALEELVCFSDADKSRQVLSKAQFEEGPLEQDIGLAVEIIRRGFVPLLDEPEAGILVFFQVLVERFVLAYVELEKIEVIVEMDRDEIAGFLRFQGFQGYAATRPLIGAVTVQRARSSSARASSA